MNTKESVRILKQIEAVIAAVAERLKYPVFDYVWPETKAYLLDQNVRPSAINAMQNYAFEYYEYLKTMVKKTIWVTHTEWFANQVPLATLPIVGFVLERNAQSTNESVQAVYNSSGADKTSVEYIGVMDIHNVTAKYCFKFTNSHTGEVWLETVSSFIVLLHAQD